MLIKMGQKRFGKSQKSQLSIFIIIGAVLVLVLIFFISIKSVSFFEPQTSKSLTDITEKVEFCLEKFGKSGVFLLGFQGGFIEIPERIVTNPKNYVSFGGGDKSLKIPNWDVERGDVPTLKSMEEELEKYIKLEENAYTCIVSSLEDLKEQYEFDDFSYENFEADALLTDSSVLLSLKFPISFKEIDTGDDFSIREFSTELKRVPLKKLYNIALKIYELEEETYFVEELVLDQIHSAKGYEDPKTSMPTEGTSFSCRPFYWQIEDLKSTLARLNNNNFKYLYFVGTKKPNYDAHLTGNYKDLKHYYNLEDYNLTKVLENMDEESKKEQLEWLKRNNIESIPQPGQLGHYTFDLGVKNSENIAVDVVMPSVEITQNNNYFQRYPYRKFDVNPRSGQLVKSQQLKLDFDTGGGIKIPIPIWCVQMHHHLYTLDYDLIFKLTDESKEGSNYFFQFPLRVYIENNEPKKSFNTFFVGEEQTATNDKFCSNEFRKYPAELWAYDGVTGNSLDGVEFTYKCGGLSCDLGTSQIPATAHQFIPILETNLPFCLNGILKAEKEGYHTQEKLIYSAGEKKISEQNNVIVTEYSNDKKKTLYHVYLTPLKKYPITKPWQIVVYDRDNFGKTIDGFRDGRVYINLENEGLKFASSVLYPNDNFDFFKTLNFLDKDKIKYNLSAYYINKDGHLQGFLEHEDWEPKFSGNEIIVRIPATSQGIKNAEDFENFIEYMNNQLSIGSAINGAGVYFK